MKTLFTLLLLWLCSFPCLAQWEQLNPGVTVDNFSDVFAISQNKAIVVGTNGTILKTNDGGETWEQKESGTNEILSNVQFASEQIGFISGNNGVFLKTVDGGETWYLSDTGCSSDGGYYGNGMSVVNGSLLFLACGGSLMKSENGGETWNTINNLPASTQIQFLSDEMGFAGSYLWDENWENPQFHTTNDGGISWESISGIAPFHFLEENLGFYYLGGLHRTTDGGDNFEQLTSIENEGFSFSDIYALNENTIWGIIYLSLLDGDTSSRGFMKISSTDSETYEEHLLWDFDTQLDFESIHFANETMGYAVGGRHIWPNIHHGVIWRNGNGINEPMNTEEQKDFDFQVYPNPATSELNVILGNSNSKIIQVEISDLTGKNVYSKEFSNKKNFQIDVKNYPKGTYILKINNQSQKILIK